MTVSRRRLIGLAKAAALSVTPIAGCGGGGAAPAPAPNPVPAPPPASPPNFIVFVTDDQRFDTLSCAGHPVVRTPVIDSVAARGTRFARAYVTTPICAASRASLITGLNERTHRFTFGTPPLATRWAQASYPAQLRKAGWRTALIGKFDVVLPEGQRAELFDHYDEILQNPAFKNLPDGRRVHETDLCAERAIAWLESLPSGQRFSLDVHFNAPHAEYSDLQTLYPWPPSVNGMYDDVTIPLPRLSDPAIYEALPAFLKTSLNRDQFFWCCDDPDKYQRMMRAHFRMISGVDAAVGRVLAALERLGRAHDTVVVVMSDNGYYLGERGLAGKWSHFEESVRIPWIVADPRRPSATRGRVDTSTVALNIDLAPTLLDLAGLSPAPGTQGRSLVPALDGRADVGRPEDFLCEHLWPYPAIPRWEGVRNSRWVYARYLDVTPAFEFLHDLASDPDQLVNLAGRAEFSTVLDERRARCDALIAQAVAARGA